MAISYVAVSSGTASANTVTIDRPTGAVRFDVLVAVIGNVPGSGTNNTVSAPAGWTAICSQSVFTDYNAFVFTHQVGADDGDDYTFTTNAGAGASLRIGGTILAIRGALETPNVYSDTAYTTDNTTVRAASVTTTEDNCLLVYAGIMSAVARTFASGVSGWDQRSAGTVALGLHCIEIDTTAQASAGASGTKDATASGNTTAKHAFLLAFEGLPAPPTDLSIGAPEADEIIIPGSTYDLLATAEDPNEYDIEYQWTYDGGTGAVYIGASDPTTSGEEGTLAWDTDGLASGTYTLGCTAVNEYGSPGTAQTVDIYLTAVVIVAPAHLSSAVAGEVLLTGKGYLTGEGQLRIQWEVDTNTPPDDGSDDYDLITSALVDQDTEVTVIANLPTKGAWYFRARTVEE